MHYRFVPIWKDNSFSPQEKGKLGFFSEEFVGDNSIVYTKFKSIEDGIEAMRLDATGLRESNWRILECSFLCETRIMLKTLYNMGYFDREIKKDDISEYYTFKI